MTSASAIRHAMDEPAQFRAAQFRAALNELRARPDPGRLRPRVDDPNYTDLLRRRIAHRVEVDANECWVWQGHLVKGYGRPSAFGRAVSAHRLAYELFVGPIPEGLQIDHLCRNRACVNPAHLEPVTHAENVARGQLWAVWGARTYCNHGHEFTPENTYMRRHGARACRTCARERTRSAADETEGDKVTYRDVRDPDARVGEPRIRRAKAAA